jgi:hypothetical protein
MATETRIYSHAELQAALAQEDAEMPLPGLVDLRHKDQPLAQTQVLDAQALNQLRSEYHARHGSQPPVSEPRESELTGRTERALGLKPRRYRLIGALLAIAVGTVSWSVCRSWMAGHHVERAATQAVAQPMPSAPAAPPAPVRERPTHPAAANLPRAALDALASGDRERARRAYDELARYEQEPGPYSTAAEILARELKAGR